MRSTPPAWFRLGVRVGGVALGSPCRVAALVVGMTLTLMPVAP